MKTDELCDSCDGKLDSYYGSWCPSCDKPKLEPVPTLNLIKALSHLVAIGAYTNDDKDHVWNLAFECWDARNDTIVEGWLPDESNPDSRLKKIWDAWNISYGDIIWFHVSW